MPGPPSFSSKRSSKIDGRLEETGASGTALGSRAIFFGTTEHSTYNNAFVTAVTCLQWALFKLKTAVKQKKQAKFIHKDPRLQLLLQKKRR